MARAGDRDRGRPSLPALSKVGRAVIFRLESLAVRYRRGAMNSAAPTPVDKAFQLAYVCAYRLMRTYWTLRHPKTHGALVALFNGGDVLLVKNSYVPYYSLPGGYVEA